MSKYKIYTIYDKKTQDFKKPIFAKTDEALERELIDMMINGENTPYKEYPEDFSIQRIGEYDEDTGFITLEADGKLDLKNRTIIEMKTIKEIAEAMINKSRGTKCE